MIGLQPGVDPRGVARKVSDAAVNALIVINGIKIDVVEIRAIEIEVRNVILERCRKPRTAKGIDHGIR